MHLGRKKILLILVAGMTLIVALAAGRYFIWRGQRVSSIASRPISRAPEPAPRKNDLVSPFANAISPPNTNEAGAAENWKTYVDTNTGFSLRYPSSITALYTDPHAHLPYRINGLIMSISSQKVDSLGTEIPDPNNRKNALAEMQALQQGQLGVDNDFTIPASRKIVKVGNIYGKIYVVFGRYITCDITFQKTLRFYLNGYKIEVSVFGPTGEIVNNVLPYFETLQGKPATGYLSQDGVCWRVGSESNLYEKLTEGKAPEVAQNWYDTFDTIISTIDLHSLKD